MAVERTAAFYQRGLWSPRGSRHDLALKSDGTIVAWGPELILDRPMCQPEQVPALAVAAGGQQSSGAIDQWNRGAMGADQCSDSRLD